MITWNETVEIDRRIARIATDAVNLVAAGDQNREYPDAVYTEAKRFLEALVGFNRGGTPASQDPDYRPDYAALFATSLEMAAPATTTREEQLLREPDTYQLVCTHVYDRLCEAYDRRHRWAA